MVAEQPLRAMSTAQCRELLQRTYGACTSSYIKGRAVLYSIFAYGIRQEWCDVNPVERVEVPKVKEQTKDATPDKKTQLLPDLNKVWLYGRIRMLFRRHAAWRVSTCTVSGK